VHVIFIAIGSAGDINPLLALAKTASDQTEYAETQPMMTIHGVGHITALTFVLTLGDKTRFGRSRDVGCYLRLRPKRSQSGERDPQLDITKAGNAYLRSLLIECAKHILRSHGRDSALRQWGLHLAARGGSRRRISPSWRSPANLLSCFTTSGLHRNRTSRSIKRPHEDDPVHRFVDTERCKRT
jgi:transposase